MKKLLFAIIFLLLVFIPTVGITYAAEETAEDTTQEATVEEFDFVEWFNENVMTVLVVFASSTVGSYGLSLVPLFRSRRKNHKLQGICMQQKLTISEQSETIKALTDTKEALVSLIKAEIQAGFKKHEILQDKILYEQKLISAQNTIFNAAAKVAWSETAGALEILSESPTATLLKHSELEKEKIKAKIAEVLGVEADELTAEMEVVYDKFSASKDL